MKLKQIQWPTFLALGVLGAVLAVAYGTNSQFFATPKAESATNVNVLGYAWANTPQSAGDPATGTDQGLGWISFNGTATDGSPYGVTIDLDTGYFSGSAWIGNGDILNVDGTGWVNFNPPSPYPSAPNHGVWKEGNTLTGWARVESMYNEAPALDMGWIKMSGTATDGSPYGVTVNGNTFSGYAWGSDVIGWVDFAPATAGANGVHIDALPCTAGVVTSSGGSWGTCTEDPTFCSTNPAGTPITGTRYGTCGFGYSTGNVLDPSPCSTGGICGGPTPGCGNGTCNTTSGETLLSCPQDCKGGVQQF